MLSCGIDVGSAQTKCVIMDGNAILQGRGLVHSGANLQRAARHALKAALREADVQEYDLTITIGTGFGRHAIPFSHKSETESTCHARGAIYRYPETRTILDAGGQEMTAIKIDAGGNVLDFAMNDKCTAGTGRFLESIADLLNMSMDEFRKYEYHETDPLFVSNACSVFAEQDVINYLEGGQDIHDIIGGVFKGIAERGASLLRRVGIEDEITFTGGVSHISGVATALADVLGHKVNSGIDGVYVGALGAALLGLDASKQRSGGRNG
jgi:predicted CoA-substrate-specific enzyme activase